MSEPTGLSRGQRVTRIAGFILGTALLVLAIGYAARGVDVSVLRVAPGWMFAALAGLVVVNLLLTAGLFWSVTRSLHPTPRVGLRTMTALLAVSGVLNYIPVVRAGLWGRAAYLKKYHGLAVRDSVFILGVVLALAVVVLGVGGLVLIAVPEAYHGAALGGVMIVLSLAGPPLAARVLRCAAGSVAWVPLRVMDWIASASRLWLCFAIVAEPIGVGDAMLLASASLLVKLTGLTPNGLGLSEWVVAALSAAMMPIDTATAAGAALVDRTVEVGVALIAGAAGAWWLRREMKNTKPLA